MAEPTRYRNPDTGAEVEWDGTQWKAVGQGAPSSAGKSKTLGELRGETRLGGGIPITPQPPRLPRVEQFINEWTVPIATGAAAFIPGALPTQMAIGAGGETLNQLAQGEPLDPVKIGVAGAVPAFARGLVSTGRTLSRSVANQAARQPMVEAAVDKTKATFGVGKQGAEALARAKGITTAVTEYPETNRVIGDILEREAKLPGGSKEAMAVAQDTFEKISKTDTPLTYSDLFESSSALREAAEAAGNNRTTKRIYEIREAIINDISRLGPEAREAFKLYRREKSVDEVAKVFRSGGFTLNKFKNLIDSDPLVSGAFSAAEKKTLEMIATHIGPEGLLKIAGAAGLLGMGGYLGGGEAGTAVSAAIPLIIGGLIGSPVGERLARSLIGPSGVVSKAAIPAFAQYMRGYLARRATPEPAPESPTPPILKRHFDRQSPDLL